MHTFAPLISYCIFSSFKFFDGWDDTISYYGGYIFCTLLGILLFVKLLELIRGY